MRTNVGKTERYVRLAIGLGAAFAAWKLRKSPVARSLLGMIGVSGISTGLSRYCPLSAAASIDNTAGPEFLHFNESKTGNFGHKANEWQRSHGWMANA